MPAKTDSGKLASGLCEQCGDIFQYEWRGHKRSFCPECADRRAGESQRRRHDRIKLREGEPTARSMAGLYEIALCTQDEAGARLAIWEALDRLRSGVDQELTIKPLTSQAIQQLERQAILKIRKACKPLWQAYRGADI